MLPVNIADHRADKSADLRQCLDLPLFAGLPGDVRADLAQSLRPERHAAGETIFRQGDTARALWIVLEGFVKLLRVAADGEETVIDVVGPQETIGVVAALAGTSYAVSAETVDRVVLARLPAADFARVTRRVPDLVLAVLGEADRKLTGLMEEVHTLRSRSANQRVARFLLGLCPPAAERCTIHLPYGKRLVADRLGLEQATLSRSFASLRAVGVHVNVRDVTIDSVDRLRALVADGSREVA